jgi:dTDP-4-dehydrorhamnose reductase
LKAKVIVIGANGQLGTDLCRVLAKRNDVETIEVTEDHLDVRNHADVRTFLQGKKPAAVINTAAYHKVDEMEDNLALAFEVNVTAVKNLAIICVELGCKFMHMSTDYVFGGDRLRNTPFSEDDAPYPQTIYGVSKLAGEYLARQHCPKHFVVRGSGLYGLAGAMGKGGNFVETMIRLAREGKSLKVVNDQRLTPTFTQDLAEKMIEVLFTDHFGLYHISNRNDCTWFEFAAKIFEYTHLNPPLAPQSTAESGAKATRPGYSVFSHRALERAGLKPLRIWQDALKDYLQQKHPELCS